MALVDYELAYTCSKFSIKKMNSTEVMADFERITNEETIKVRSSVPNQLNVHYGASSREVYDIYGTDLPEDCPILVFIHGGYWQALDKNTSAVCVKPLYDSGVQVIISDYDLCPDVSMEKIVEETKNLALNILEYAAKRGSSGVFIMGHSAGAHLTSLLLDPKFLALLSNDKKHMFKGIILVSGVYDLSPLINTTINEPLKITSLNVNQLSTHTCFHQKTSVKMLITLGKYESSEFHRQATEVHQASLDVGNSSELFVAEEDDHFTIIEKLSDPTFILTKKLVSFIQDNKN